MQYENYKFIENDPIQIPHCFSLKEDIEISGFLTASISWGRRKTIIDNAKKIMLYMDNSPYDFILNHTSTDLYRIQHFAHRTFNKEDLFFFIKSLQNIYTQLGGLEAVFSKSQSLTNGIINFRDKFFSISYPLSSTKHVANINKGSAAKRLNMFLRWMVRDNKNNVDFGIWRDIKSSDLFIPLDVHGARTARKLNLLKRKQNDWQSVVELTNELKKYDFEDPIKYDFALFGIGVNNDDIYLDFS